MIGQMVKSYMFYVCKTPLRFGYDSFDALIVDRKKTCELMKQDESTLTTTNRNQQQV